MAAGRPVLLNPATRTRRTRLQWSPPNAAAADASPVLLYRGPSGLSFRLGRRGRACVRGYVPVSGATGSRRRRSVSCRLPCWWYVRAALFPGQNNNRASRC
jgi:hypothetical protein